MTDEQLHIRLQELEAAIGVCEPRVLGECVTLHQACREWFDDFKANAIRIARDRAAGVAA